MFGDVDASGLGHFGHQVRLLEAAEFQFLSHVGINPGEWFLTKYLFPRVKLVVDYTAPLHFSDKVQLEVQVGHLGTTSFSLLIDVINMMSGKKAMEAKLVIVVLDPITEQPTPLPAELRVACEPYLATVG